MIYIHITIINNNERCAGRWRAAGSYQPPDVGSSIEKENLFVVQKKEEENLFVLQF